MAVPSPQPVYRPDLPTTFVADSEGWLIDPPFSLEVEVLTDDGDEAFPRSEVDVGTDLADGGDRLGPGYFRAANYDPQDEDWSPGPDPGAGRRTLRWFCVLEDGGAELTWTTTTERLADGAKPDYGVPYYALIADLRDEGFSTTGLSDAAAARLLAIASQYVERFTGNRFVAEPKDLRLNGRGGPIHQLAEPIVAIGSLAIDVTPDASGQSPDETVDRNIVRIYNRHLTQRLRQPDDRQNPKLELYYPLDVHPAVYVSFERLRWPVGQQNVKVSGVFGYTEADGSPMGRTPMLIAQVAMMIVARVRGKIGTGGRGDTTSSGRISSERTRDQSVSYEASFGKPGNPILGAFTGDPEIDTLLASFMRTPALGAV